MCKWLIEALVGLSQVKLTHHHDGRIEVTSRHRAHSQVGQRLTLAASSAMTHPVRVVRAETIRLDVAHLVSIGLIDHAQITSR